MSAHCAEAAWLQGLLDTRQSASEDQLPIASYPMPEAHVTLAAWAADSPKQAAGGLHPAEEGEQPEIRASCSPKGPLRARDSIEQLLMDEPGHLSAC